ncbi:MAG: hypothetical protein ICV59_04055 [Thermoleophilia bacterium]|nr:hypothetical protein [Thermoleophilia bacterium]
MAEGGQRLLGKLADAGEEAIQKVGDMPGLTRVTHAVGTLRERMDDLQKRVRGLEDVERRLAALEKKVETLSKQSSRSTRRTPAKTAATTPKTRTPRRKPSDGGSTGRAGGASPG